MSKEWKIPWSGRSHDYTEEEINFIIDTIKTADPLTQGKYLNLFEEKLKTYLKVSEGKIYVLNSATSALELSAAALNIKEDEEVIIPAHTFTASALPFLRRKAKIVWADIDPETWVVSFDDVSKKITDKTKAMILVDLYGIPVDRDSFLDLASCKWIRVIEDSAQAFGAEYRGQKAGTFGDFGIFSFHAQKNMTTFGEGGAIFVKDESIASLMPGLRSFGFKQFTNKEFYWKPAMTNIDSVLDWELPYKFTISEIQCAIGYKLLDRIDELNKVRKARYWKFRKSLSNFPELRFQKILDICEPSYHLLPTKYEAYEYGTKATRDDLIKILAFDYGIQVIVQYYPLYRYDLYKKWGCGKASCPNTDNFFDNMISFPFHVWMKEDDFDYMVECTIKALKRLRG